MKLFFDIETIPSQLPNAREESAKNIKVPGNISKPETIEKWKQDNAESEYRKQSFDGLYGEIISIAWAIEDETPRVLFRGKTGSEYDLLKGFFEDISYPVDMRGNRAVITKWIGHYITGFDLRFLWQRCVVNNLRPPIDIPYDAKPWDERVFDTKIAWSGVSQYSGASKLDLLCKGLGFEGKGDLDGSKVFDYWLKGRYEEIAEYNKQDVEMCRNLYKRMTFQRELPVSQQEAA